MDRQRDEGTREWREEGVGGWMERWTEMNGWVEA